MNKLSIFTLVILLTMFTTGCTITASTINTPEYIGKSLSLGVVGEAPKIREEHVSFTRISFEELEDYTELSSNYDAVIIMKDHLEEAAEGKYAKVYKNADIPFFFMESTKSYMPFVLEEVSYDHPSLKNYNSDMYATGYLHLEQGDRVWGYGIPKVNEPNIKDAYSRIFTTIEYIGNGIYDK